MSCFLFCLLRARNILLSWRGYVLFQNVAAGAGAGGEPLGAGAALLFVVYLNISTALSR